MIVAVVVVAMLSHLALLFYFYYLLIGIRSALLWVLSIFDAGNDGLDRATDRATEISPTCHKARITSYCRRILISSSSCIMVMVMVR
mmetsp:Transcript_18716/g.45012  ORF Transcript_18716/g.45012 Transcript_18716/m.45012 type:complete len:87 (+) Transcript_18716:522-782(+)